MSVEAVLRLVNQPRTAGLDNFIDHFLSPGRPGDNAYRIPLLVGQRHLFLGGHPALGQLVDPGRFFVILILDLLPGLGIKIIKAGMRSPGFRVDNMGALESFIKVIDDPELPS